MKTAVIFGSSGLIGNELFKTILLNNIYSKIIIFVRSTPEVNNPKVEIIKTDFNNLHQYKNNIKGNDCYFCIGTTKKDSPEKSEYRRIEHDIPIEVARIAKANSINSFIYVSSIGANANAASNYLKNKGQVEEELINLNFPKLIIIRPSLLVGSRRSFRLGEVIFTPVMNILTFFAFGNLKKYKPIKIENVVKAMLYILKNNLDETIFESDELEKIANSN